MSLPLSDLVGVGEGVDLLGALAAGLGSLVNFIESWDYGALPPEVNSARLTFGPGPAPMMTTAGAYTGLAGALNAAAAASDGSTTALSVSWRGPSSDRAQAAFRNHATWLRGQAAVAEQASTRASAVAGFYSAAHTVMPPLPVIIANRVTSVVLAATNSSGQNTAAIAINEMLYLGMWIDAAATMYAYQGAVVSTLSTLPPPLPPPSITAPGGGSGPDPFSGPMLDAGWRPGPSSSGAPGGGSSNVPTGGGGGNGGGNNGPTSDSGGGGHTSTAPAQAGDPAQSATDPGQAVSDVNQAAGSMTDSLPQDGATNGDYLQQHGFYGTSPYSTTLAGLNGGAGSVVAFSMMRGGIGTMPGTATGFKMPANWRPGAGRAFGASAVSEPETMASSRSAAPRRGVTAPKGQMRRRRKKDEKAKSEKVFVPGEQLEVPVLEKPPVVGVIEYGDELRDDPIAEESLTIGVLGRADGELAVGSMNLLGT